MKTCTRCKVPREDSCFEPKKRKKSYGLREHCRDCRRLDKNEWKARTYLSEETIIEKIKSGKFHVLRQSPIVITIVMRKTEWMPKDSAWLQRLYHLQHGIETIDKCIKCNKKNKLFMRYKMEYSNFCGRHCQKSYNKIKNKIAHREVNKRYNKRHPHIYAWRSVLNNFLKRVQLKKTDRTHKMLRYSAIELREHLNKLLKPGMTWNNYGKWHVDHKLAVTNFPSDTPCHIVNGLPNLQPLWAGENMSKGNKII